MIPVAKSYPCDPAAHEFLDQQQRQEEERRRQERRRQEEERQRRRRRRERRRQESLRQQYRRAFKRNMKASIIRSRNLYDLDNQCRILSSYQNIRQDLNLAFRIRRDALHNIELTLGRDMKIKIYNTVSDTGSKLVYDLVILRRLATGDFYSLVNLRNVRHVTFEKKVYIPDYSEMLSNSAVLSLHFKDEAFIGMSVFSNLSSLLNVYFEKSASIYAHAFSYCSGLEEAIFEKSVKIYMGAFMGCKTSARIIGDEIEIDYSTYSQLWNRGVSFIYSDLIFSRNQGGVSI